MEVRRIGPGQGLIGEIKDLRKRIQTQETRPAGSIVIRETMETVDPETGVKTIFGQLPDGSVGIQPFVYDITPPPVASAPIVTADPGVISISWDGLFAGAGVLPRDFECVNIIGHKMNGTITVSSTPVGMIRRPLDFTYLQQDIVPVGETWQFSLESEDYNGNRAAWGARSASVTMESVVTDAGVNAALEGINQQVITAQSAAASAQNAANAAQQDADTVASNLSSTNTAVSAAQLKADQAFNNATTAASAAGTAQSTADGKNTNWYQPTQPAGTGHKVGDTWFDTDDNYKLRTWSGSVWQTTQDSALAQQIAESKALVYTQPTTPPLEARVASTIWNDTSLGLDKIVVKYWDGNAWTALADKAATDASMSASTAMSAQSYSTNASFDDWTGTYPTGYTFWNSTPVKETTIVRRAPNALRFNVPDATTQAGLAYASIMSHAPNLEYYTVELEFYLASGGLGQAGMILDWGGLTNNRAQINLFDEVPSPAIGKWYRVVKTLRRPTNATGTFTSMNGYLMGQWSGHTGGGAAKNIIFDWFNVRPSSVEEILAFNSTTVAQAKADAAQAAAITAAQATTMLATAYSKNPSFDDWASTLPDTYSTFGTITPTKDTTNKRIGTHGLKFTVPGTEDAGINFIGNISHMPNVEYITVELEFMLTSGTLAGAGVLLDWNGLTPIRSLVKLTDHVLTPVTGKWYRISAVVARPANATGTWTSMGGWLMANWNELGTKVAKTITYDWLNVRPSTAEEITAYKAPAKYTELSGATTTAQQSADGKNKVHYSTSAASGTTDPTDNNRPFVEGDTWYQRDATTPSKIIAQWEFTGGAWVSRKITGLVLTEVDAGTITVGYLRGENLSATAIDGKTITGALFQTEQTASRGIKLTSTELAGYDTAGLKNFSLTSAGSLTIVGAIQSGGTISGTQVTGSLGLQTSTSATAGVKMNNTGIKAWDGANNLTFHLDATTGYLELPGLKANSINGDRIVGGSVTAAQVRVGDFSNLVTNGFGDLGGGVGIGASASFTYDSVDKPSTIAGAFKTASGQSTVAPPSIFWDVTPNTEYVTEVWLKADLPNSRIYIELKDQANAHGTSNFLLTTDDDNPATPPTVVNVSHGSYVLSNLVVPTVWTKYTIRSTTTATATRLRVGNIFFNHLNGTERNAAVSFAIGTRRRVAGSLIVDGAITTAHMTSGTIDAGVLTAGSITAPKIASKSITVDKLVVSSTNNLVVEADFGNGGASWGTLNANKAIVATAGRGSLPALRVTGSTALQTLDNLINRVTVGTEDRFRGSMYVKSSVAAASGVAKLRMKAYTTATAFTSLTVATSQALTAGAWTLVEGYSPALPANTIAIEFFLEVQNAATGTTLDIDYVGMTRAADGKLVIDGAIDGKTITGALFQTDNSPLDSTASRGIKLNSSGLKAYSPTGVKTFGIDALTGEVSSSGTFATTSSEYVEGSGTMTIGAIFGNLTYNSHTEYSGIPGIKFTRTHSSEGVKPPASILYDGKTINLSTYPDDNGFTPNTAGSNIGVGEGTITMGASRNGEVGEDYIPSPSFELHGGTVAGPGYEKISQVMSSKPSTDWMHVGLEIENYRGTGVYNKFTPFSARLFNRSNQYQGTKLGVTEMAVHDGGRWEIKGSRHSDGVLMSSLSSDVSGNFRLQAESVRIGNAASNLNEITINPGPGIVMKGQTRIVGDLTMDTNSGQWGGIVDAAGYKINGQVMSGGEVQTWDVSGVMPNAAIPVPKVGLPLTNAAKSTSQSLASTNASNPGELTIINSAVYDITFSYGQTGGTTADRSFIEVKLSGNDRLLGRASIANGEDSASCTVTGVRLDAGAVLLFEVYQNSGGSKNYSSRITIKRAAAPVPVTAWEVGNKVVEGNLSVSGSINQGAYGVAPVRYYQSDIVVSYPPNGTLWGPGVFVKNESASIGGDFITIPLNDQFRVTQAGVYDFEFQFYLKYVGGGQPRALLQRQVGGSWETLAAIQRPENTALWEFNLRRRIHCAANDLLRLNFIQSSGATQQWDTQMTVAKIG